MTILSALQMVLHPNGRNSIDPATLAILEAPDVLELAKAADMFAAHKGVIWLDTLASIALDPLQGEMLGSFVIDGSLRWFFDLRFDRLSHFIQPFTLDKDDPISVRLIKAIRTNLSSPMFEAAKEARRMGPLFVELDSNARGNAWIASTSYRSKEMPKATTEEARAQVDRAAADVYNAIYDPVHADIRARSKRLNAAAAPGLVGRSCTQWVAETLLRWLDAARHQQAATARLRNEGSAKSPPAYAGRLCRRMFEGERRMTTDRFSIDPRSTAGILLREFGDLQKALAYADRIACGTGSIAQDYAQAALAIRSAANQLHV